MSTEDLNKSFQEEEANIENSFFQALRTFGYLFPENANELDILKAKIKNQKIELPEELNDPLKIIQRGKITHLSDFNSADDKEIELNMAMAAREGKEIPEEILRQMEHDRKEAEEKNHRDGNTNKI